MRMAYRKRAQNESMFYRKYFSAYFISQQLTKGEKYGKKNSSSSGSGSEMPRWTTSWKVREAYEELVPNHLQTAIKTLDKAVNQISVILKIEKKKSQVSELVSLGSIVHDCKVFYSRVYLPETTWNAIQDQDKKNSERGTSCTDITTRLLRWWWHTRHRHSKAKQYGNHATNHCLRTIFNWCQKNQDIKCHLMNTQFSLHLCRHLENIKTILDGW